MPSDYNDWRLRQMEEEQNHNEQIAPEEWDEFCEEIIVPHAGGRPYEDQSWIYGRKDR